MDVGKRVSTTVAMHRLVFIFVCLLRCVDVSHATFSVPPSTDMVNTSCSNQSSLCFVQPFWNVTNPLSRMMSGVNVTFVDSPPLSCMNITINVSAVTVNDAKCPFRDIRIHYVGVNSIIVRGDNCVGDDLLFWFRALQFVIRNDNENGVCSLKKKNVTNPDGTVVNVTAPIRIFWVMNRMNSLFDDVDMTYYDNWVQKEHKSSMCTARFKNMVTQMGTIMNAREQSFLCQIVRRRYTDVVNSNSSNPMSSNEDIRLGGYGNGTTFLWKIDDNDVGVPITNKSFTNWAPNEPKNLSQCLGVRLYDCLWESIPCWNPLVDDNGEDNTTLMCTVTIPGGGNYGTLIIEPPLATPNRSKILARKSPSAGADSTKSEVRSTIVATSAAVSIMSMASDGSGSLQVPRVSFLWQMKSCNTKVELDVFTHPTGLQIGTAYDTSKVTVSYHIGAAVINTAIIMFVVIVQYFSPTKVSAKAPFPSVALRVGLFFHQTILCAIVYVVLNVGVPWLQAVMGTWHLCMSACMFGGAVWVLMKVPSETRYVLTPLPKRFVGHFFLKMAKWEDHYNHSQFVQRYGALFRMYREDRSHFFLVELVFSFVFSVTINMSAFASCRSTAMYVGMTLGVYLVVLTWVRPQHTVREYILSVLTTTLQFMSAMLEWGGKEDESGICLTLAMVVSMIESGVPWIRRGHGVYQRKHPAAPNPELKREKSILLERSLRNSKPEEILHDDLVMIEMRISNDDLPGEAPNDDELKDDRENNMSI
eukprot:PhF_6_TR36527/c0_g1_i2/m.53827